MPRDPYRNFRFEVEIDGFVRAGFQKVAGLTHTIQVINYREGGDNEVSRKLPGQSEFGPVTLERGMSNDADFSAWIRTIFRADAKDGAQGSVEGWRKDVTVYLKDKAGARVKKWTLLNTWPSEVNAGDLDGGANDVLMETLVLQNEGMLFDNLA